MLKWMATSLAALTIATSLPAEQSGRSEDLKKQQNEMQREINELKSSLRSNYGFLQLSLAIQHAIAEDFYTGTGGGRRKSTTKKSKTSTRKVTKKKTKEKNEVNDNELALTPEARLLSSSFKNNKGKLPWPVENAVIRIRFGPYKIPGMEVIGNNPGITLAAEPNAEVKVVFDGEVLSVFNVEGNRSVMVRHGNYFTVYANLASVNVTKNQKITGGQVVGVADNASDGNGEIEFILMKERTNIDPAQWIKKK
jgi:septal ring factor EnvC (AmiA/AmiB activator)